MPDSLAFFDKYFSFSRVQAYLKLEKRVPERKIMPMKSANSTKFFLLLYLFLGTSFLGTSRGVMAKVAIVTAQKAIIYSDKTLRKPKGYLKKGKIIRVSAKRYGRAWALKMKGRFAFIPDGQVRVYSSIRQLKMANGRRNQSRRRVTRGRQKVRNPKRVSSRGGSFTQRYFAAKPYQLGIYLNSLSQKLETDSSELTAEGNISWIGFAGKGQLNFKEPYFARFILARESFSAQESEISYFGLGVGGGYYFYQQDGLSIGGALEIMTSMSGSYSLLNGNTNEVVDGTTSATGFFLAADASYDVTDNLRLGGMFGYESTSFTLEPEEADPASPTIEYTGSGLKFSIGGSFFF